MSLGVSLAKKTLSPEHMACAPTRVPNKCDLIKVPAAIQNIWFAHIDFMLNKTPSKSFELNRFDFDLPQGKSTIKSLGQNTKCQVVISNNTQRLSNTASTSAVSCQIPPQADCFKSPKRICCDCSSGSIQCS